MLKKIIDKEKNLFFFFQRKCILTYILRNSAMKTEAILVLPVFIIFFFFLLPSLLLLPFTFSSFYKHECYPAGALQQKVLLAQPERFPGRLFLDPASLPSLTPCPVLPFAKSVITMRPVRSTYRSLSQTELWRSHDRACLLRRKGE